MRNANFQYKSDLVKKSNRATSRPKVSVNLFTKREIEVIRLICRQYSNQEMADKLKLNIRTIESFRESILKKAKAKNVVGVVIYALRHGMYKIL